MKKFFESGFLMSHEGSFPMGVKLSKSKKVYPKCVVAQRLGLLTHTNQLLLVTLCHTPAGIGNSKVGRDADDADGRRKDRQM